MSEPKPTPPAVTEDLKKPAPVSHKAKPKPEAAPAAPPAAPAPAAAAPPSKARSFADDLDAEWGFRS